MRTTMPGRSVGVAYTDPFAADVGQGHVVKLPLRQRVGLGLGEDRALHPECHGVPKGVPGGLGSRVVMPMPAVALACPSMATLLSGVPAANTQLRHLGHGTQAGGEGKRDPGPRLRVTAARCCAGGRRKDRRVALHHDLVAQRLAPGRA